MQLVRERVRCCKPIYTVQCQQIVQQNVKFVKFHKVPELFPNRKVRIVCTEQLWLVYSHVCVCVCVCVLCVCVCVRVDEY